MRCRHSRIPPRSVLMIVSITLWLAGSALAAHWLALPAAPVAAAGPVAQDPPFLPATLVPTPTPPPGGPPRRNISPITPTPDFTPPATPPALVSTPLTPTPGVLQVTPVTPVAVNVMQVGPVMLAEAERRQNMQFNPNAALQKRIFADGLVPNSPEFRTLAGGLEFGAQRAESLTANLVRVYFVAVPNFANVSFVQRPNPANATEAAILAAGEAAQVIQFNPNAALQRRMFADGFVPNSSEFSQVVGGVRFIGQRGERLDSGSVRVYFVQDGVFNAVFFFTRG